MAQSSHTLPLFQAADQPSLSCTHVHFSEYPGSTIRRDHIPSQSKVLPYDLQGRKALIRIVHTQGLSCLAASKNNEGLEESDQGTCRKWRLARLQSQHSPPPCATSKPPFALLLKARPPGSQSCIHYSPYLTWPISHIHSQVTQHLLRTWGPGL